MANQGEVDKKIQDRLDEAAAAKAEAEARQAAAKAERPRPTRMLRATGRSCLI